MSINTALPRNAVLGDCDEWTQSVNAAGYGRVLHVGGPGKHEYAHRYFWRLGRGPIPDGTTVDHICLNRLCVNLDHLRLLPWAQNSAEQGSAFWTHCHNGHEFTPDNTYWRTAGNGRRMCRRCHADRQARYKLEKQQRSAA